MTGMLQSVRYAKRTQVVTLVLLGDDGKVVTAHCDAGEFFKAMHDSGATLGSQISWDISDIGTIDKIGTEADDAATC